MEELNVLGLSAIAISGLTAIVMYFLKDKLATGAKKFANHDAKLEYLQAENVKRQQEILELNYKLKPAIENIQAWIPQCEKDLEKVHDAIGKVEGQQAGLDAKFDSMKSILQSMFNASQKDGRSE